MKMIGPICLCRLIIIFTGILTHLKRWNFTLLINYENTSAERINRAIKPAGRCRRNAV